MDVYFKTDEIVVQQVLFQSGQTATFVKPKWRDFDNIFFVGSKAKMLGDELGVAKLEHVCGEEAILM